MELLTEEDFTANPFLVRLCRPERAVEQRARYLVDPRVVDGTRWITGADEPGKHVVDLVAGRDFVPTGTIEAAEVREGDLSPDGRGVLTAAKGIEIGHIFQLGQKYTNAFEVDVLGENGAGPVRLTMALRHRVSRLVAVIAEQCHDDKGLRWPREVTPFDVHVVIANKRTPRPSTAPKRWWRNWMRRHCRWFSTTANPLARVKFKDAELGVPTTVVVGRGFANGVVEVRDRFTGEAREISVDGAAAAIAAIIRG